MPRQAAPVLRNGSAVETGVRKACCLLPLADFVAGLQADAVAAAEGFLRRHPGAEEEPPTVVVTVDDSSYSSIETSRRGSLADPCLPVCQFEFSKDIAQLERNDKLYRLHH